MKYICFIVIILFYQCKKASVDWPVYRSNNEAQQFSALSLLDTTNVHLLQPAWEFHTGDTSARSTIECNPLVIGNKVYITSPALQLFCLDGSTGTEIWRFKSPYVNGASNVNRGLTYYKNRDTERIFHAVGHYLFAIDANNGNLHFSFGDEGKLDLRQYLGKDTSILSISLTTPGIIHNDLLIIGSATGEGYNASPGHIRAFDANTGAFKWIFHTIPNKGEEGYDTWSFIENENYGGTNNWGGMSLDQKKGIVFIATGSPTYDFYGANRKGTNLFGNSIIALEATTGKKIWHYQTVKHDIWDYDLPCAPTLATIQWNGNKTDILMQPTKMGELILLDRLSGKPLLSVKEKNTPSSLVPHEEAWPSQSFDQGIKLVRQAWDSNLVTNISDTAASFILKESRKYLTGMYTPPSLQGTLTLPATRGGMLWGGVSYNPLTKMAFANCNEIPMILQLDILKPNGTNSSFERGESLYKMSCTNCHGTDRKGTSEGVPTLVQIDKKLTSEKTKTIIRSGKGLMPAHTHYTSDEMTALIDYLFHADDPLNKTSPKDTIKKDGLLDKYVLKGFRIFTDQEGFPGNRPPWGTLNAIDIETQKIKWSVPLGFYPKLKDRGISNTGTQTFGGCVATAGHLVFIGATADEMFRAFNANTGAELWQYKLPAGGYATPSIYAINGKQYVLIAAGGGNRNATPSGDSYIAFALK